MFWSKDSTFLDKLCYIILFLFLAFPVVDYLFRTVLSVPILAALWHNLLLMGGLFLVGLRLLFGNPRRSTPLTKVILAVVVLGLAYITLDLTSLSINFEGFRAVFQYMFVFFVAFYLNDRPENTRTLMSWAVIIGTLMALVGIYQWIVKLPMPAHWVDVSEAGAYRVWSITTSPNALGSQMAMTASIALGLFMYEKQWLKKSLWLAAAAALVACLVFTGSRGAWLAFAGGIAILGMLYDRRILLAVAVAAVLAVVAVPAVRHRIFYLFTPEYMAKSAHSGRISRWFTAYDQMRSNPLFGAGLGHFGGAVAKRNYSTIYVDNYYMKTLAEMGLTGITAFLWLMLSTVKEGYGTLKSLVSSRYKYLALGMLGSLLVIMIHNSVENIFEIPYLNIYFWLTAGLLTALPSNAAGKGVGPDAPKGPEMPVGNN